MDTTTVTNETLGADAVFCSAFLEMAKQEVDRGESILARRILSRAEEVYLEVRAHLVGVDDGAAKQRLRRKLLDIRSRLDILDGEVKRLATRAGRSQV
jgi:hypothetical protein